MAGLGSLKQLQERYGVCNTPVRRSGRARKYHTIEELQAARRRWAAEAYARRQAREAQARTEGGVAPPKLGRKRKYFTAEELAAAKRATARRAYEKKCARAGKMPKAQVKNPFERTVYAPPNKKTRLTEEQRRQHERDVRQRYQRSRFTHLKEDGILTRRGVRAMDAGEAHLISVLDMVTTQADGEHFGRKGFYGLGGGCFMRARHHRFQD